MVAVNFYVDFFFGCSNNTVSRFAFFSLNPVIPLLDFAAHQSGVVIQFRKTLMKLLRKMHEFIELLQFLIELRL